MLLRTYETHLPGSCERYDKSYWEMNIQQETISEKTLESWLSTENSALAFVMLYLLFMVLIYLIFSTLKISSEICHLRKGAWGTLLVLETWISAWKWFNGENWRIWGRFDFRWISSYVSKDEPEICHTNLTSQRSIEIYFKCCLIGIEPKIIRLQLGRCFLAPFHLMAKWVQK